MRRVYILVAVAVTLVLLSPQVTAETNGLSWGVQVGERFDFVINARYYGEEVHEDFYVTVGNLPDLDVSGGVNLIPPVPVTCYWWNGSDMFSMYGFEEYFLIIPVGNWTRITEIVSPTINVYGGNIIDNFLVWGFNVTIQYTSSYRLQLRLEVGKADGVPTLLQEILWDGSGKLMSIELSRKDFPSILIMGIGGGAIVLAVLAIVIKNRRSN